VDARIRLMFLGARLIPNFLGMGTIAILTRLLDPPEYGIYALGVSITFFVTLSVFEWLGLSVLRMMPAAKDADLLLGTILTCFYGLCGLCAAAGTLAILLLGHQIDAGLTIACTAAVFASAWFELKQRLQLAELRDVEYLWMSAARGLITMAVVCATAYLFRNPALIMVGLALSIVIASSIVKERRLTIRNWRFDWTMCGALFRFGFPLSISVGLATILMSVDKWMLQALSGPQAVGLFTAATFVGQMPISALAAGIGSSAYSMVVRAVEFHSPESARAQLAENFIVLIGSIVPGAAGIIALSHNLTHLMVGAAYWQSAIDLVPWLSAAAIFYSVRAFYVDTAFQLAHHNSPLIWTMLGTVAVNVVLDFQLIPVFGELGAAIGSCIALFVGLVVGAVASRRVFRLPVPLADTAKVLASTAIMFSVLRELSGYSGAMALAGQIIMGLLIYAAGIIALNVLGVRDWLGGRFARAITRS
jgi:O-antigen/teichoic acid export membrane protein